MFKKAKTKLSMIKFFKEKFYKKLKCKEKVL